MKQVVFFFLLFISSSGFSQREIAMDVKLGAAYSSVSNYETLADIDGQLGFNIEQNINFKIYERWRLLAGVGWLQQRFETTLDEETDQWRFAKLTIPIGGEYAISENWYAKAGLLPSIHASVSFANIENETDDVYRETILQAFGQVEYRLDNRFGFELGVIRSLNNTFYERYRVSDDGDLIEIDDELIFTTPTLSFVYRFHFN